MFFLIRYFEEVVGVKSAPGTNPADFVLEVSLKKVTNGHKTLLSVYLPDDVILRHRLASRLGTFVRSVAELRTRKTTQRTSRTNERRSNYNRFRESDSWNGSEWKRKIKRRCYDVSGWRCRGFERETKEKKSFRSLFEIQREIICNFLVETISTAGKKRKTLDLF